MSPSLALLPLLLALQLPPHGRVNSRCYTAWNSARTNLDVVWDGARYSQPWTFSTEVDSNGNTCTVDGCVQRLWCTDSGAAGRYTRDTSQSNTNMNNVLAYTWLRDTSLMGQRVLAVQGQEGDSTTMTYTNAYGHGTVLVMGSRLFFYTWDYGSGDFVKYALPRLTSLVFAEYQACKTADQLVTQEMTAFSVLGYSATYMWDGRWTPIYPAGSDALTVSVEDYRRGDKWAVDVSLTIGGSTATRKTMVHYLQTDVPSVRSASRELMTVPGFSCRGFTNGTAPICYCIGESATKYTWATTKQAAFEWIFLPISTQSSFALPSALWLHDGTAFGGVKYRVLATYGLGSVVAFNGSTFFGVETRAQAGCAGGSGLFLASYDVSGAAPAQKTLSASLGCASTQRFPASYIHEDPYEATHVKWLGPFTEQFPIFAASDVAAHEYCPPDWEHYQCPAGEYKGDECQCLRCLAGYSCDGFVRTACAAGSFSGSGASACVPCGPGSYSSLPAATSPDACTACPAGTASSSSGASDPASCLACSANQWAAEGFAACRECPLGSTHISHSACSPDPGHFTPPDSVPEDEVRPCPAGHACPGGDAQPTPCEAGTIAPPASAQCVPCDGNTWAPSVSEECRACPEGSTHVAHASCSPDPGHYTPPGSAPEDKVLPCPAGHACAGGDAQPVPCPPGFFALAGAAQCALCPDGYACSGTGPMMPCQYALGEGAAACLRCPAESVWLEGACVGCASLPSSLVCEEVAADAGGFHRAVARPVAPRSLGVSAGMVASAAAVIVCAVSAIAALLACACCRARKAAPPSPSEMLHV